MNTTVNTYKYLKRSALVPLRLFVVLLLLCVSTNVKSQLTDYSFEVKFREIGKSNGEMKNFAVRWTYKTNYNEAQKIYDELKKKKEKGFNELRRSFANFGLKVSKREGTFDFQSVNGAGVIIVTGESQGNGIYLIKLNDGGKAQTDDDGLFIENRRLGEKMKYDVTINTNILLEGGEGKGTFRGKGNTGRVFDYEDGNEYFEYHLEIPITSKEKSSRIILFPSAVDCMTDDIIDYMLPAVYEGNEYHQLQDKRKAFDYFRKDPLGGEKTYVKTIVEFDTTKIYSERKVRKFLENPDGSLVLEDGIPKDTVYIEKDYEDSISVKTHNDTIIGTGYVRSIESLQRDRVGENVVIDTTIVYKKPRRTGKYRGSLDYTVEDYHHQSFTKNYPGTCLRISPYKFLEMTAAAVDLELTSEFAEIAEEVSTPVNEGIDIQFIHGKADTLPGMVDWAKIRKIERDMQKINSGGGQVVSAVLIGYASPDGSRQTNINLAGRRASFAKSLLRAPIKIETKEVIDTWEHTANMLEAEGFLEEARTIKEILSTSANDQAAEPKIRRIPTYKGVIDSILQKQCRIEFRYNYISEHQMDAQEAVEAYYQDRERPYSNGDYYNMFMEITDSAELDKLTDIAYNRIIKNNDAWDSPLGTYIINRKAVLDIRRGLADSTTLKPLIYEYKGTLPIPFTKDDPDGIRNSVLCNRPEILINQAVTFYQLQEPKRAKWIIDKLKNSGYTHPNLEKLNYFISFKDIYKIKENDRSERQKEEFAKALRFLENPGPENSSATINNRAVLYTEFEDLKKRGEAWKYVHMMSNEDPRKWYLMALLWATGSRKQEDYPLPLEKDDSDDIQMDETESYGEDIINIPYYMAYFQKSFDINPEFMRYYFNEGYVDEEMRKMKYHAYQNKRVPLYRKIFQLRQKEDEKEREEYLNNYIHVEDTELEEVNDSQVNDNQ